MTLEPTQHFVGVDLAWGERNPTGVAVLDHAGRLVELVAVRSDEQLHAALFPFVAGPCVVAIDAPIIVTNPSGKREAERLLDRDFARFQAGTHASNMTRPWFSPEPRALRLARHLELDLDPLAESPRRAIEVYPHAATVALFGLRQTLKYKSKSGRTVEGMRAEMLVLTTLIAGLADADPPVDLRSPLWAGTVTAVSQAERKSDLRRCEDPIDALLCAYVALLAHRSPDAVTIYGSAEAGAIVTPTLGHAHSAT